MLFGLGQSLVESGSRNGRRLLEKSLKKGRDDLVPEGRNPNESKQLFSSAGFRIAVANEIELSKLRSCAAALSEKLRSIFLA